MKKRSKAFTLVELIVVITILAILATIGFVSFSGYLAGTRDTNRIAQLKSMSDALELYRTKKDLPIPDDKVDIKANGSVFAYQGDIGKNVLETIEYTESGLDPKDKNYFSYYLTKNKKYFQLMAFLEEENKDVVAMKPHPNPLLRGEGIIGKSFATDYSDRKPFVKGKKLGVLTDEDNTPIQKVSAITGSGFIETKTATGYIANVDNGKQLTGREISGLKEIAQLGGIEKNLVAWYDFETIDGTGFLDLSGHHYTGNIIGGFAKIHTGATGPVGKAMIFDGDNTSDYIILPNEILDGKKDYSVSMWIKNENMNTESTPQKDMVHSINICDTDNTNGCNSFAIAVRKDSICSDFNYPFHICKDIENTGWKHIFTVKNNDTVSLYINGKLENTMSSGAIDNYIMKADGIVIGQDQDSPLGDFDASQAMKGELDDLRIYEGTMSEGRIEKIYRLGRK